MPEYRIDPVTQHSVIIAPERRQRPGALIANWQENGLEPALSEATAGQHSACPFCAGHEAETPPALATIPTDPTAGPWQVRVVPNLYPATQPESNLAPLRNADFLRSEPAVGQHEVVIESPDHKLSLTELPTIHVRWILEAYVQRLRAHANIPGIVHATIFKNHGRRAGASLEHVHSQILSLDRLSPAVDRELRRARQFAEAHHSCMFCQLIREEANAAARIVEETEDFIVFCPFASRLPYEFCIYPKRHRSRFDQQTAAELDRLAEIARRSLLNLEKLSQRVPYNYLIRSAPFDIEVGDHYHWHMEVLPRLSSIAGFEWGSSIYINPVPPEQAAEELRPSGS